MLGLRRPPRSHRRPGPRPKGRKPGAVVACGRLRLLSLAWLLATLGLAWAGHRLLARRFHGAHPQQQHRAGDEAAPQGAPGALDGPPQGGPAAQPQQGTLSSRFRVEVTTAEAGQAPGAQQQGGGARQVPPPQLPGNATAPAAKRVGQLRKELRMRDGPYRPLGCSRFGAAPLGTRDAPVRHTWVFRNTYLQPDSIGYSHMASVTRLPPSATYKWMATWQSAAVFEGTDDQRFMVSYSQDRTRWTPAAPLDWRVGDGCMWSPAPFRTKESVVLFYAESSTCRRPTKKTKPGVPEKWHPGGSIRFVTSQDGQTWSIPRTILKERHGSGIPKVIANPPIELALGAHKGWWVLPYWEEVPGFNSTREGCVCKGQRLSGTLISRNHGATWETSLAFYVEETWLIEGTIIELRNGSLLQMFRTDKKQLYSATSSNGGFFWSTPQPYGVPNPNAKVHMLSIQAPGPEVWALAYNHESNKLHRHKLYVAMTADAGRSWHKVAQLTGDSEDKAEMHGYPYMVQDGCTLLVGYSIMHRINVTADPYPMETYRPPHDTGIVVAEIDLRQVDLSEHTRLPEFFMGSNPPKGSFLAKKRKIIEKAPLLFPGLKLDI